MAGKKPVEITVKTHQQVAEFFGRSLGTVEKWSRQGMPGRKGSYPLSKITAWLFLVGPWRSEQARDDVLENLIQREPE